MLFSLRLFFPLTVPVSDFYPSHENYFKYIKYTWYSLNFFLFQTYTNNLIYKLTKLCCDALETLNIEEVQ